MSELADWPSTRHSFELPLRHHLTGPVERGLVVCLHGYQDHALSMLKRLGWWAAPAPEFGVLAINAPFPVPIWSNRGFTEAYAWYFRDATRGVHVGSPEAAAGAIFDLMRTLKLDATPSVIVGFSQGGFLAPAVAARLAHARAIIGIGTGFPADAYEDLDKLNVFGIHGAQDDRVDISNSRREHAALNTAGFAGDFFEVAGAGHRITPEFERLVRRIADDILSR